MNNHKHLLEVYEPYGYEGPNPMHVQGTCVLRGPNGGAFYLLSLRDALLLEIGNITQLLVQPRYNGDKIERAEQSCCTVCIARVLPGVTLDSESPFTYNDVAHWGVGKIMPILGCR